MNDASQGSNSAHPEAGDDDFRRTAVYRRNQKEHRAKLVVVVHGMGDQTRNDLVQTVARLFARQAGGLDASQATLLPLGLWDASGVDKSKCQYQEEGPVTDHAIGFISKGSSRTLDDFAFAEVYWADLPRRLEQEGYRLEESKRWAGSLVERLNQRHDLTKEFGDHGPQLAATVIEEISETVRLLERILFVAEKAGKFKFDLGHILESYLADVQQVADFRGQRALFLERFLKRMDALVKDICPHAEEIHIVAHSEGSVLAFLGLLTAMWDDSRFRPTGRQEYNPDKHAATHLYGIDECKTSWIERVRSFTTLGSPIDKHLILFPDMWYRFTSQKGSWKTWEDQVPIRWRNYYDLGDPVGYDLDTARQQLDSWKCKAFDFEEEIHDHGFRRYPIPGKAHVDYFEDVELFGHIIADAVEGDHLSSNKQPRGTILGRLARYWPFVLVAVIHAAAVFALHQALVGDSGVGKPVPGKVSIANVRETALAIFGCSALLIGTTVVARLFRITRDRRAQSSGVACFVAGAILFCCCVCRGAYILSVAGELIPDSIEGIGLRQEVTRRTFFVGYALLVAIIAWRVDVWRLNNNRSPRVGLRLMVFLGGVPLCLMLAVPKLLDASLGASSLILLSGALAFLYLWWLGALVFDLAFCWAWYISTSKSLLKRAKPEPPPKPVVTQAEESASGAD